MISYVVNMRMISVTFIYLLSIILMLSSTTYSQTLMSPKVNQSAIFMSEWFEVGSGEVASKLMFDIEFPKGHIGVKSFDVDLVDEQGKSVPLHEAYLHHYFVIKVIVKKNLPLSHNHTDHIKPVEDPILKRNHGVCNNGILPQYWGFGSETRGTSTEIPDPFAVEHGNPTNIPEGWEEKWLFTLMVIDIRGTENKRSCTECRCDHFNLPENFYNVSKDIHGKPLTPEYKGGIFCCQDNFQCKLKKGFKAPRRKLALRYKVTWVDWDQHQIPVRFYILDSADHVSRNGSRIIHDCLAEYTIPKSNSSDPFHVQKASIPMEKGGYLIYGTAHMHTGVVNATLYGQDGRILCTSIPRYGTGNEAGNEKGYAVGMSVCYPKPGSIKIKDGETVTVESRYKNEFITGAMGHMYVYLADQLPLDTKILNPINLVDTEILSPMNL